MSSVKSKLSVLTQTARVSAETEHNIMSPKNHLYLGNPSVLGVGEEGVTTFEGFQAVTDVGTFIIGECVYRYGIPLSDSKR